jgi:hypothetical protein
VWLYHPLDNGYILGFTLNNINNKLEWCQQPAEIDHVLQNNITDNAFIYIICILIVVKVNKDNYNY